MTQPQPTTKLPGIVETADDGDRPSITEVNGTVARFEMAYNPDEKDRFAFGPPWWRRLPSLIYLGFALTITAVVLSAYYGSSNTTLYRWVVEGNKGPLAFIILITAVGTVVRTGLLGVIVTRDGIETRTLSMGFPRIRKWSWPQIDRLVLDGEDALLELWDGTYERLPKVADGKKLVDLLERVAHGRGRQVTRLDVKRP